MSDVSNWPIERHRFYKDPAISVRICGFTLLILHVYRERVGRLRGAEGAFSNDSPTLTLLTGLTCWWRSSGTAAAIGSLGSHTPLCLSSAWHWAEGGEKRYQPAPCFIWRWKDLCKTRVIRHLDAALSLFKVATLTFLPSMCQHRICNSESFL